MTQNISILAVLDDKISQGLKGYLKEFANLEKGLLKVEKALAPVTSKLARLGASLVGVQTARRAVELGREQLQVEQRLLSALDGRKAKLEEIKALTAKIQDDTTIGDEVTLGVAASLANLGVPLDKLDAALLATVDTSKALGVSLETVGRGVAQAFTVQNIGLLARRLPDLQEELSRTGDATQFVNSLLEKFGGTAASMAENEFGDLDRQTNRISDTLELFGSVVANAVTPAIQGLADGLDKIVAVMQSPFISEVITQVSAFVPQIAAIAAIVGSLLTGATAVHLLSAPIGIITGAVSGIASILAAIVVSTISFLGIWGLLAVALAAVLIDFEKLKSFAKSIAESLFGKFDNFAFFADGIRSGRLEFSDMFDFIFKRLDILKLKIAQNLINPITLVLNTTKTILVSVATLLVTTIGIGLKALIGLLVDAFDAIVNTFVTVINFVVPKALDKVDLRGKFDEATNGIDDSLNNAFDGAVGDLKEIPNVFKDAANEAQALAFQISSAEQNVQNFVANAEKTRANLRLTAIKKESEEFEKLDEKLRIALNSAIAEAGSNIEVSDSLFNNITPESIRSTLSSVTGPLGDELKQTFEAQIDQMVAKEGTAVGEIYALRKALLNDNTTAEIEAVDALIVQRKAQGDQLIINENQARSAYEATQRIIDKLSASGGKNADSVIKNIAIARDLQGQLTTVIQDQKANADDLLKLDNERNKLALDSFNNKQAEVALGTKLADAVLDDISNRRDELVSLFDDINGQVESGILTPNQGTEQQKAAITEMRDEIELALVDLVRLKEQMDPALSGAVDVVIAKMAGIREALPEVEGGFFDGLILSTKASINALSDANAVGREFGSTIINELGTQTANALAGIGKNWKEFGKTFLAQLSAMIFKLLIFKAIAASIGFLSGSGTTAAATQTGASAGFNPSLFEDGLLLNSGGKVPYVPGASRANTDSVRALLTVGEEVVDRDTANYYGRAFFEMLKKKMIPRSLGGTLGSLNVRGMTNFATGGTVQSTGNGSSGLSGSVVVSDEQTFARMLAGNDSVMLAFLSDNGFKPTGI